MAYALVEVEADSTVKICERGYGAGPWDPRKRIEIASYWVDHPGGTTADAAAGGC